ncbi:MULTISPECIES: hypothetical protein [Rhizobium]|uniref:hypothetical protein n=1 Tax=Rhizobium TaxID=379 RepID=UPI0018D4F979|nr:MULTISPECIES: hypothetical protein [Rhizobium]
MASANTLSAAEVSFIKGMLSLNPRPTDQKILAYFTRPDRDLNHRLIGQIRKGVLFSSIAPATETAVRAFMLTCYFGPCRDANLIAPLHGSSSSARHGLRYLLLDWWPVGQGLFSSGAILAENGPRFNWIYDCGTSSKDKVLADAIASCHSSRSSFGFSRIDLAILSHFDHDHISGFSRLVQTSRIRMVLLPYLTPLQRLVMALQQGVSADDALFGFYVDPVGYLRSLAGGDIGEIVFVLPSGPDDDVPPPPIEPAPDLEGPEEPPIKFEEDTPPEGAQGELFDGQANANVRYLKRGGAISVPFDWEFLPYNDPSMLPKVTKTFQSGASRLVQDILSVPTTRRATLAKLKKLYDTRFGKSSKNRNIISLFVYSGPIDQSAILLWHTSNRPLGLLAGSTRFAQMYTGDGTLGAGKQFAVFEKHYWPGSRLARAGILQVMHHGAEGNWHAGLASLLSPEASIFSSDPSHKGYGHPHAAVLRDFWAFNPVQVDVSLGLHILGAF